MDDKQESREIPQPKPEENGRLQQYLDDHENWRRRWNDLVCLAKFTGKLIVIGSAFVVGLLALLQLALTIIGLWFGD